MSNYRFQTVWWTPAAIERVWETLAHYSAWSTWWRGIRKVEVVRSGDLRSAEGEGHESHQRMAAGVSE